MYLFMRLTQMRQVYAGCYPMSSNYDMNGIKLFGAEKGDAQPTNTTQDPMDVTVYEPCTKIGIGLSQANEDNE